MKLTEIFTICDSCVYALCLCGNDPKNCVAYVTRTPFTPYPRQCGPNCGAKMDGGGDADADTEKALEERRV